MIDLSIKGKYSEDNALFKKKKKKKIYRKTVQHIISSLVRLP